MATILKHWREAATLILVAKSTSKATSIVSNVTKSRGSQLEKSLFNYEILMLKRSTKSTFMPNVHVFPGGTADDADFSSEWLDIFKSTCDMKNLFDFVKTGGVGPYMFSRNRPSEFQQIPSELAFRICAIRETFEESGVLLARTSTEAIENSSETDEIFGTVASLNEHEKNKWRKRVDSNPEEFILMCKELKIVPDIWSLYEWSNWLTPTVIRSDGGKSGRRYDTAFYICVLDHMPNAVHDDKETVHTQWSTPGELIGFNERSEAKLAPPQRYEMSRLLNFQDVEELHQFSVERTKFRVSRFFPVPIFCSDGYLVTYPGDELYPENPDVYGDESYIQCDSTIADVEKSCTKRHRIAYYLPPSKDREGEFSCNVKMTDGQVLPLTDLTFLGLKRAKL